MDEDTKIPAKKSAYLGMKIPPGLRDNLDELAKENRRTRSAMACILLEGAIAEAVAEKQGA